MEAALEQRHGTMLVVSAAARDEALRLRTQALPVQPAPLSPDLVAQITNIDGAVLLDQEAVCHAVGVILDGQATASGDPSRGARYNSAIRYQSGASAPTLCIVVSEDGYVDLVPKIRPLRSKEEVSTRVEALKTKTIDNYMKTYSWLDEHRFYLTGEQCAAVNQELERILSTPMEVGEIRLPARAFGPDPEMNETYYARSRKMRLGPLRAGGYNCHLTLSVRLQDQVPDALLTPNRPPAAAARNSGARR